MNSSNSSSNSNQLVNQAITESGVLRTIALSQSLLTDFALNPLFYDNLAQIFGNDFDSIQAEGLRQQWINGNFTNSPEIEVVPSSTIDNGNGAYSAELNKIFLAEEFLQVNSTNLTAITELYLEEWGHFVDTQIKDDDSEGDEGRIFAHLVVGDS